MTGSKKRSRRTATELAAAAAAGAAVVTVAGKVTKTDPVPDVLHAGGDVHVDVVQNDWANGAQRVVARLWLDSGHLEVVADDEQWKDVALRPTAHLHPDLDPERFFNELGHHFAGSYSFATLPHHGDECPYHDGISRATVVTDSIPESQLA